MFEVGFSELLVIFALALVVLGPERLPKLAAQVGRWVGRARAMARQFREQLEAEASAIDPRVNPSYTPRRTPRPPVLRCHDPPSPQSRATREHPDRTTATNLSTRMSEDPETLASGTLISHLLELRTRLIRALVVVLVAFLPCAFFKNEIFTAVAQPLIDKLPKGGTLIATGVISPFMTPFKLAFFVAVFLAMPFILFQVWAFVAPGLYRREKRFAVPLMMSSVALFYAGVAFAYFVGIPGDVCVLRAHHAAGRLADDRHHQLHGFRARDVPGVRRRLRGAGGGRAAGVERPREPGEIEGEPRLRAHRRVRGRRRAHAAGCDFTMHHGGPDVPAVRGRAHHGPAARQALTAACPRALPRGGPSSKLRHRTTRVQATSGAC